MLKTAHRPWSFTGLSAPISYLPIFVCPKWMECRLSAISAGRIKDAVFLILTCVEDFEQAQEAIAYSVSGYLLKLTMDFKEVEKCCRRLWMSCPFCRGGPSYVGMPNLFDAKERFLKEYFTPAQLQCPEFSSGEYVDRLSASSERKESSCRRPYSYLLCFLQGSQASLKGTDGAKLHSGRSP